MELSFNAIRTTLSQVLGLIPTPVSPPIPFPVDQAAAAQAVAIPPPAGHPLFQPTAGGVAPYREPATPQQTFEELATALKDGTLPLEQRMGIAQQYVRSLNKLFDDISLVTDREKFHTGIMELVAFLRIAGTREADDPVLRALFSIELIASHTGMNDLFSGEDLVAFHTAISGLRSRYLICCMTPVGSLDEVPPNTTPYRDIHKGTFCYDRNEEAGVWLKSLFMHTVAHASPSGFTERGCMKDLDLWLHSSGSGGQYWGSRTFVGGAALGIPTFLGAIALTSTPLLYVAAVSIGGGIVAGVVSRLSEGRKPRYVSCHR